MRVHLGLDHGVGPCQVKAQFCQNFGSILIVVTTSSALCVISVSEKDGALLLNLIWLVIFDIVLIVFLDQSHWGVE